MASKAKSHEDDRARATPRALLCFPAASPRMAVVAKKQKAAHKGRPNRFISGEKLERAMRFELTTPTLARGRHGAEASSSRRRGDGPLGNCSAHGNDSAMRESPFSAGLWSADAHTVARRFVRTFGKRRNFAVLDAVLGDRSAGCATAWLVKYWFFHRNLVVLSVERQLVSSRAQFLHPGPASAHDRSSLCQCA